MAETLLRQRGIAIEHIPSILADFEISLEKHKRKTDFLSRVETLDVSKQLDSSPLSSLKSFFTGGYDERLIDFFAGQELSLLLDGRIALYEMKKDLAGSPKDGFCSLGYPFSSLVIPQNRLVQLIKRHLGPAMVQRKGWFARGKSLRCVMTNQNTFPLLEGEHYYRVVTLSVNEDGPEIYVDEFGFRICLQGTPDNQFLVMEK